MTRRRASLHAVRRPGTPSAAAAPATLARTLASRSGAIAAWTLGWTLFQWWAVVGWAEGGGVYAGLLFTGMLGVVGRDIGRRFERARPARPAAGAPGAVLAFRRASPPPTAEVDEAA